MRKNINYISMKAHPSLLSDDQNSVISYTPDQTYFRYLDPLVTQNTNFFIMESVISMKDNIYDLFDTSEIEVQLFEEATSVSYSNRIAEDKALKDRDYLKIFLRANNEQRLYKREGYDILTYLGDLGGLADVLLIAGSTLTGLFSAKLFQAALISSAYRLQSEIKKVSQHIVKPVDHYASEISNQTILESSF